MEDLLAQVPELNLRENVETRTIHRNDLPDYPNRRVGDVIELVSYTDSKGVRWTKADIKYYLFLCKSGINSQILETDSCKLTTMDVV